MNTKQLVNYTTSSAEYFLRNRGKTESIDYLDGYLIEDIIQDSLEKLLKSKVEPQTKTYITNTVLSVITDIAKRTGKRIPRLTSTSEISEDTLVPLHTSVELLDELVASLDTEDTLLFNKYHVDKLTVNEVSILYGVSERTIKRRLSELSDVISVFLRLPEAP